MANAKFKSLFRPSSDEKEVDLEVQDSASKEKEEGWLESEGQLTIDVYQTPQEIIIKSAVAGVKPEDIDISIVNDMITIKGQRSQEETVKSDDYFYQECYWGRFSRSVILPVEIDSDRVSASLKNGILTVKMPKLDKAKIKKVKIKAD
ncbi:MAG TPA: Hsp20/alpha crystallin family protein [Candidatus Paceibacterota bacterium]|nr:Hsp20/alpha crystallin family protein [Candidatus Paceibacterota bacterium]HRY76893.1 Hsp20/alpha crystallin family protein [Candidatus Paceibacterota bacterium]